MITITNEHSDIFLKQPRVDELKFLEWLWSDENTMESVGGPVPFPEDVKLDWYKRMVQPGDGKNFYCLIYTNDNEKVGEVSFHQYDEETRTAHFNVKVANDFRGRGYGRQAALLLLDYFFHMVDGNQMIDEVAKDNIGAKELLMKCGFEELSSNEETKLFSITKDHFEKLFS